MQDVLTLALPFFGLILVGFASGKIRSLPAAGLDWMNFFILYLALPALFFQLLAQTPVEELTNLAYVAATTFATYCAFALAFCIGVVITRGNIAVATIQGMAGAYSNIGYMGPGLTLAALGSAAAVPTALIFCFDNILLFTLLPLMMALGGTQDADAKTMALRVLKQIFTHPFIIATILGVGAAAIGFQPPRALDTLLTFLRNAAAPCALFALGVSVALRPLVRVPGELPVLLLIKLILHPLLILALLNWIGGFEPLWVATAVLMACLPPAANVFVMAQSYHTYVERASAVVMLGTLVSVVTVTAFLYLITNNMLPGL
ncbi:AEC family transporter [Breoghania sp. L-A4]|uniref:AEC family transporter n=1 Tax=Breoghania sp. L-A4 TaxID=2304600 RepID=UPI000E35E409|nr:AEC family transporter [Breoghania sp. L-A4]AXS40584.1 AEC family transporter [Breoghania sp. L-A4]